MRSTALAPTPSVAVGHGRALLNSLLLAAVMFVLVVAGSHDWGELAGLAALLIGAARVVEGVLMDLRQSGRPITAAVLRGLGLAFLGALITGSLDALNLITDGQLALFVPMLGLLLRDLEAVVLDAGKELQAGARGGSPARVAFGDVTVLAGTDEGRRAIEGALLKATDNGPRPEDGEQPA